jgi:ribonuclease E
VQRWGTERAPGSSVLLRTGLLMSLASLGTAGLVVCGALAVRGPSGAPSSSALGSGLAPVRADASDRPTVLAPPSPTRLDAQPAAPRSERPTPRSAVVTSPVGVVDVGGPLSGTASSAAQTLEDLDSSADPARALVTTTPALLSPSPSPTPAVAVPAPVPQGTVVAVRGVPARPATAQPRPAASAAQLAIRTTAHGAAAPLPPTATGAAVATPKPVTAQPTAPEPVTALWAAPEPVEVQPAAPQPAETRTAAPKPDKAQTAAPQPAEVQPAASKQAKAQPAPPKQAKTRAAAPKPAETRTAAPQPATAPVAEAPKARKASVPPAAAQPAPPSKKPAPHGERPAKAGSPQHSSSEGREHPKDKPPGQAKGSGPKR